MNHLFRQIIFSIHGHSHWIYLVFFTISWRIFLSEQNALFYLIINIKINMIFLIDWQWVWFKNYFEDIKTRKSTSILMIIRKMFLFSNRFSIHIVFSTNRKSIHVIQLNKKRIKFLFIAVIYFPLSIEINILTLYNNCYVILTTYLLDWAPEARAFI